jgi:uncharacterized protein YjbI with pentapeptide repeats
MGKCKFKAIYNNLKKEEHYALWPCDQQTDDSSIFCVFHDSTRNHWDDKTIKKFVQKVTSENPLFCIGYHFPENFSFALLDRTLADDEYKKIKKNKQRFNMLIYLCDAEFDGQVEFSYCIFEQPLNLSGAIFRKEVLFRDTNFRNKFYVRNTKFYENVNFRGAKFQDADFHDTLFKDKANFHDAIFQGETRFLDVKFRGKANFKHTKFCGETGFWGTSFKQAEFSPDTIFAGITKFRYVVFEDGEKVDFGTKDLSNVSFLNTDITRVKFAENVYWGGEKGFTVIDERELKLKEPNEQYLDRHYLFRLDKLAKEKKDRQRIIDFLETNFHITVAENTQFVKIDEKAIRNKHVQWKNNKGSWDYELTGGEEADTGTFPIILNDSLTKATLRINGNFYYTFAAKKGEKNKIKIYYFEYPSIDGVKAIYRNLRENYEYRLRYDEAGKFFTREMELKRLYRIHDSENRNFHEIRKNNWFRRNLFSVTGWYYHLARYGESLIRPTLAGAAIIFLSTIFWLIQINPIGEPSVTNTVGLANATNITVWQSALERSMADILPAPSGGIGAEVKIGLIDFVIKVIGGAITFGLLAIALRRRFERRFRH